MKNKSSGGDFKKLARLRVSIDRADSQLLKALGMRFRAVETVGVLKKRMKLPVVQKGRWNDVMKDRLQRAKKENVGPRFTKALYNLIHREAIRLQKIKR